MQIRAPADDVDSVRDPGRLQLHLRILRQLRHVHLLPIPRRLLRLRRLRVRICLG